MSISYQIEDWRIRRHLSRAEKILRRRDVSALSPELQAARNQHLDHLHAYRSRGQFPRNTDRHFQRVPCFIDRGGCTCAVADVIIQSGDLDLAHHIDFAAHNARIRQMHFTELDEWVAQSGLTVDELALIQPGYDAASILGLIDIVFGTIVLILTVISILVIDANRAGVRKNLRGWRLSTTATFSLLVAFGFFCGLAFVVPMLIPLIQYYFGSTKLSDIAIQFGTSTLQESTQAAMARPLIIAVVLCLVALVTGGWALISGVVAMRVALREPAAVNADE